MDALTLWLIAGGVILLAFVDHVRSPAGQAVLTRAGFAQP